MFPRRGLLQVAISLLLFAAGLTAQERGYPQPEQPLLATVVIRVRSATGTLLPTHAIVRITANAGAYNQQTATRGSGEAEFTDVPIGSYTVEVSAPGFVLINEQIQVSATGRFRDLFFINLKEEAAPGTRAGAGAVGPPILAPKAREELDKGLASLREKDLKNARKHLERALKMAPGNPDVHYLLALMYVELNDPKQAKSSLEKALSLYPEHVQALTTLGEILSREEDYAGAARALEKALTLEPDKWRAHALLAIALYHERDFEKARIHVERALELNKGAPPEVRLLRAQVLDALGEREHAREVAEAIVRESPEHPSAQVARRIVERTSEAPAEMTTGGEEPTPAVRSSDSGGVHRTPETGAPVAAARPPAIPPTPPPAVKRDWAPPDVDAAPPAVTNQDACPLPAVLERASQRARELVENLKRVAATETVQQSMLDGDGNAAYTEEQLFNYVVDIRQPRPGRFSVEEYRESQKPGFRFRSGLETHGMAALALVFHPFLAPDFETKCEGMAYVQGRAAWVVHFRQRTDRPNHFRTYRTGGQVYPVYVKGRAWLSANTSAVLRMETDLIEPVPAAHLTRDHIRIEYGRVQFEKRSLELWLPSQAELHTEFRNRRYRLRHSLRDFLLFSVDVGQKIDLPPEPEPPPQN